MSSYKDMMGLDGDGLRFSERAILSEYWLTLLKQFRK